MTVGPVIPYEDHLLPTSASGLMQALRRRASGSSQIRVPIDTIKTPQETHASLLPFLGWERGVNIWTRRWIATPRLLSPSPS